MGSARCLHHRFGSLLGALLVAFACCVPGCDTAPVAKPTVRAGPLPEYETAAAAYDARVRLLERVTAQVSVIIEADKPDGGRSHDQLEGNLSVIRPLCTALRLDKVGQTVAYLGSNETVYWWFDLSGKEPLATGGTHLKAKPEDALDFGLPVHPLEFIELLAVLPVPAERPEKADLAWSPDGTHLLLTVPSRWGARRFTLDPETYEPSRIELFNAQGKLGVGATLSRFTRAVIEGQPGAGAPVPTKIEFVIPGNNTRVLMILANPTVPLKIKPKAFELSKLIDAYGVKSFIDHDELVELRRRKAELERDLSGSDSSHPGIAPKPGAGTR
jgi:hypothetical protein